MGFFDRFFNKPTEPSITRRTLPGLAGRITAHQAWAVTAPVAKALDQHASLTLITSGLDMDHKGCSGTWEFIFFLPKHNATLMLSVEPDPENSDIDTAQRILTQRIHPASPMEAQRPVFPDHFRDTAEVVAEFSAHGVDFVAGPSDMKLEGRVLPSGDAVWVTYYWDQEHSTSFKRVGS